MLRQEEEVDVEVTWEDQQMINSFGRLNAKIHELADEYNAKKEELANVEDASADLFLQDDDKIR